MSSFEKVMDRIMQSAYKRATDPALRAEAEARIAVAQEAEKLRLERQAARDQEALRAAAEDIGLSQKHLATVRGGVHDSAAVSALVEPVGLTVLSGSPGTGKTVAASKWLFDHAEGWPRPVFVSAAKLSRWSRYDDSQMDRLLLASRLVVDDLGVEYLDAKGSYMSLLDELINERYANSRPTVLTTNLDAAGFKERYGERIADRIRDDGRFMALGTKSLRRKDAT